MNAFQTKHKICTRTSIYYIVQFVEKAIFKIIKCFINIFLQSKQTVAHTHIHRPPKSGNKSYIRNGGTYQHKRFLSGNNLCNKSSLGLKA